MKYCPFSIAVLTALFCSACQKSDAPSKAELKKVRDKLSAIDDKIVKESEATNAALSSLDSRIAELEVAQRASDDAKLTRERALELLREHYKGKTLPRVTFRNPDDGEGGVAVAQKMGLITNYYASYKLTDMGKQAFASLKPQGDGIIKSTRFPRRLQIGPTVTYDITKITGIRRDGSSSYVKYQAAYNFPKKLPDQVRNVIYTGVSSSARFLKYDDGWRVAQ